MDSIRLQSVGVAVYRVPIATPVQTSFGLLKDRAAVVVRVVDDAGREGFGEVWCNFPTVGAEHRARLLAESVAPLALARDWASPADCHFELTRSLQILALQSGEPGPIAQVLAGLDLAMWDIAAKREGLPLWRMLGGKSGRVKVYASGLNPTEPERLAASKAEEGYTAFKLKVGFGVQRDVANLGALRSTLGTSATLMVDANQAWSVEQAIANAAELAPFGLIWLEEPIAADEPLESWTRLARESRIPLAAGENFRGGDFDRLLSAGVLKVIQPDVAKWGGFSGCMPKAQLAAAASAWFCPHWLGGGIGLLATLHLKAAIGGEGFAEVDANPNPLRELLAGRLPAVQDAAMTLPQEPGLGARPDFGALARFRVFETTITRPQISQGQP
jgi:D-galactarolactone cycloisomerase